jgi:hypothetical protein
LQAVTFPAHKHKQPIQPGHIACSGLVVQPPLNRTDYFRTSTSTTASTSTITTGSHSFTAKLFFLTSSAIAAGGDAPPTLVTTVPQYRQDNDPSGILSLHCEQMISMARITHIPLNWEGIGNVCACGGHPLIPTWYGTNIVPSIKPVVTFHAANPFFNPLRSFGILDKYS